MRLIRLLAFLAFLPCAAFATPALVTWKIQDGTGVHTQYFCDMSGTGAGPFQPIGATDASCNQLGGGGGGGAVTGVFWQTTQPVSGTFWQATQPVSGTVSANATQTGTWTVQPGNTANTTAWKVDGSAVTQPVSGTFWQTTQPVSGTFFQTTQPVSAASLPLPSGASTAAKQPALGTASAPSADVLSVQETAGAFTIPGCTVGVSSAQCLATSTAISHIQIQNTSASANVACSFTVAAVLNSSTSVQLAPGQSVNWGGPTRGIPSGALNCIASISSTPLYLEYN